MAQAKRDGLRSRAAYKLIEIDDKHHFLKPGITVVDLGAAPGGWSQIAAKRVGAADGKGKVIAIDLLEMPEISGVTFAQLDFLAEDAPEKLLAMMGGRADVVLSDMAANTTGHRKTDQLRILGLVEGAAAFAADVLNPGGTFVAKVFQSGADAALMTQLKRDFATVEHVKPASSRKDSSERYVLAMGFRGAGEAGPLTRDCEERSDEASQLCCFARNDGKPVARMERSEIRGRGIERSSPDCAALHPGYGCRALATAERTITPAADPLRPGCPRWPP